ncbi:LptF/LptG family permease [bacterium]|nr:LptF/LptG family permease [bacterium]
MFGFQRYLFLNVLRTTTGIVLGLALIALLTQGLSQIDMLVENGRSMLVYLWVSTLAAPQIVSLLLPIAVFVATTSALNAAHRDNEIVVSQAAGLSNWKVASPVLRLASLAAILHLGLNLWIQPTAYREMRATLSDASTDLASTLFREGQFAEQGEGLTVFARQVDGSDLYGLLVYDSRDPAGATTYIAKSGAIADLEGMPAIIMRDGQAQQLSDAGGLDTLQFQQWTFDLAPFIADEQSVILKESDRFLTELFFPDMTNFYDNRNADKLLAEGHARIAAPLLNIAMAMIAIVAVLGGDFSRRGYARRIALAATGAVLLRLAAFGSVSAAEDDPALNVMQYLLPIGVVLVLGFLFFIMPRRKRGSGVLMQRAIKGLGGPAAA